MEFLVLSISCPVLNQEGGLLFSVVGGLTWKEAFPGEDDEALEMYHIDPDQVCLCYA